MKLSIFNLRGSTIEGETLNFALDRIETGSPGEIKVDVDIKSLNPGRLLRKQMLDNLLISSVFIAGMTYLLGLPAIIQGKQWDKLLIYALLTIGLFILTRMVNLQHAWRALIFIGILFAGGAFMLATEGLSGNGRLLLLALPILATFLFVDVRFSRLLRYGAWAASLLALVTTGLLAIQGYLLMDLSGMSRENWVAATIGLLMISLVGILVFERYIGMQEENNTRQGDLERESGLLKSRLTKQARDLQHRLNQIHTAAEINAIISGLIEPQTLFLRVCELVKERFGLYYVGIFLIEPGTNMAVLTAGTGEAGKIMLAEHHQLEVGGDSMIGWATANRRARIALDTGQEAVRFNNPHLPETRSELALPILSQTAILGAMTIQSQTESAFDQDDIMVLQSVADSLASAIENSRLFQQVQENLEEISTLHRQYLREAWIRTLEATGPQEFLFEAVNEPLKHQDELERIDLPIRLRDQVIGNLWLETDPDRKPGAEELTLAEAVLSQTALALENARLLEETRQRADQEILAASIATKIWSSRDIETILTTTLRELGGSLDVESASIEIWPQHQGGEV